MTNIIMRVRENNRRIVRGGTWDNRKGRFIVQAYNGETISVKINLADWLGAETISSVAITSDNATVTQTNASGIITLTVSAVSGCSDTSITITTSDGRVRIEKLSFTEPNAIVVDDYGWRRLA